MWKHHLDFCFLFLSFLNVIDSKRLKDDIYIPLENSKFCFKRSNGTREFGCTSSMNGNVGVVQYISDLTSETSLSFSEPSILLLKASDFTGSFLTAVQNSSSSFQILGLIVLKTNERPKKGHSDDNECPNEMSSLYRDSQNSCSKSSNSWNPTASSFLHQKWNFPIFLTSDPLVISSLVNDCYYKYNFNGTSEQSCAIELKAHMYSTKDSATCMRRSTSLYNLNPVVVCDPLGDVNLFYFQSPRLPSPELKDSIILITSRLDTASLFDGLEFGSSVSSLVTLLMIAKILSGMNLDYKGSSNILFGFFNGESFDYIGSSRFVYDMEHGLFPPSSSQSNDSLFQVPLELNNIKMHLELDQFSSNSEELIAHVDDSPGTELSPWIKNLIALSIKYKVNVSEESPLPPSSSHSLLKVRRNLPTIVLSDYTNQYNNPYFHSIYDAPSPFLMNNYNSSRGGNQPFVRKLGKIVEMIAELLVNMATETTFSKRSFSADKDLINELLSCYIESSNCSYFRYSLTPDFPLEALSSQSPFPQYVGVSRSRVLHGSITARLLAYLTGKEVELKPCETPKNQNIYSYFYLRGTNESCIQDPKCGICFQTTTFESPALSPAFLIDNYNFSDATYSAWTESVWKSTSARMFLKGSEPFENGILSFGVLLSLAYFLLTWWLNRNATFLFNPIPSTTTTNSSLIDEEPT